MAPNQKALPDVVILCGGQGTRLRSVLPGVPKSLAMFGERAFLDILLERLFAQGVSRVILAVGYLKERFIERYSEDPRIRFSLEDVPLGTGGALMRALSHVETEHCIAMNGDCYSDADMREVYRVHAERNPLLSIVLSRLDDASDFGSVRVDADGKILAFEEKAAKKGGGLVNAGIYVFNKSIAEHRPAEESFSLERDLFPALIPHGCYGYVMPEPFLDIGTPERYDSAKKKLAKKKE